jgi:Plant transposon protein
MFIGGCTCPRVWHGQYEGTKEGLASIVLEAVADYTTRIWHTTFGFPGTLNDINIWDQSNLLKSFLDGSFSSKVRNWRYRLNRVHAGKELGTKHDSPLTTFRILKFSFKS